VPSPCFVFHLVAAQAVLNGLFVGAEATRRHPYGASLFPNFAFGYQAAVAKLVPRKSVFLDGLVFPCYLSFFAVV